MHFEMTEEQKMMQKMAKDFAEKTLARRRRRTGRERGILPGIV